MLWLIDFQPFDVPNKSIWKLYPLLQDILIERHGPQSKKSRKKSVNDANDVVVMSSSEGSDCEGTSGRSNLKRAI